MKYPYDTEHQPAFPVVQVVFENVEEDQISLKTEIKQRRMRV
jgi:hypothetical protein